MHEEAPFAYEPPRAERVQPVVRAMIEGALDALQTL
jgi:N-formylglutamate deformylase